MAIINVNDAYILDETGEEVDKTTGIPFKDESLTKAEAAQARANIRAGGTNPNLLDNPWWGSGEVVNQRSFASLSGTGKVYTIDRWERTNNLGLALTLTPAGMKFSLTSNGSWAFYEQYIGRKIDEEATYTFSIMDDSGNIYSATRKFVSGTSSETYITIGGMSLGLGLYGKGVKPYVALGFGPNRSGEFTIRAVKLELGSVSTLANDVPPDYAEELAKCKYYFERLKATSGYAVFGNGIAINATNAYIFVPITPKRTATYTVTSSGSLQLYDTAGHAITGVTKDYSGAQSLLALYITSTGLTAAANYLFRANSDANAYIDISADL